MKKILVVIDYQKDFVDGALGFKKAETLEEGIYNKGKENLAKGNKVVFTYDTHFDNYLETKEGKHLPVPHCYLDTDGHELYGRLKEFIDKAGYSLTRSDKRDIIVHYCVVNKQYDILEINSILNAFEQPLFY